MEQKQISCGPVYDRVPPLSAKYQWFVAQSPKDQEGTGDQFFYNIQDPLSCYHCRIPELLGKRIRGSFHGWLILSNDNMWSLWNPVTSKIMRLPPLILKDGDSTSIKECCLSLPPDDPKSILLLTRTDKPTFVFCLLDCRRKWLKWNEVSYVVDKKREIVTFEDPLSGYKYFMKKLPASIGDGEICYSAYGWLLFYTEYGLEFCNPFTDEVHDLPGPDIFFYSLCISAPPTSPDCMVVGFNTEGIYIHFVHGEQSWRLISLDYDDDDDDDDDLHFYFPTLCGQDLYALCDDGKLHVFKNLAQEDFSWKKDVAEAPRSCCRSSNECFLTKCGQHLLLVIVAHFGESIEVFKLNDITSKWEKINGLGRHVIYISDTACHCSVAKMPEMENKIFFARLYNKNRKVVFYSLETGMYHTFNAKNIEESFGDFVGTKHCPFNPHAWIEPTWS